MGRQDKYQEGHWYVTNSISVWSRGNISSFPVMKLLQEHDEETNHMQRRINQIIELHELRERESEGPCKKSNESRSRYSKQSCKNEA